ncbi:MAG: response regulator transcription factor [Bacteroidota bacterium]
MSQTKLNILIVEDDLSFALELKLLLKEMGYHPLAHIDNGEAAYDFIYEHRPDLILMDIDLNGKMTGTELGQRILAFEIPIIYVTSFQNEQVFKAAQQSKMLAYLVKPISKYSLQAAIANALQNAFQQIKVQVEQADNLFAKHHLFIKRNGVYEKIYIPDIQYIHSNDNYCNIYTLDADQYNVRASLSSLEQNLPSKEFLCVHRQYIVQLQQIEAVDFRNNLLRVQDVSIPISRSKRGLLEEVMRRLN